MTLYLIVGGGMCADAAVQGIRECDPDGEITALSAEPFPPYNRPPLSKGLWKGDPRESVWRHTPTDGVTLCLNTTATTIDRNAKVVIDQRGRAYRYDRLLLATGGSPRRLGGDDEAVIYFRTLADYDRLAGLTRSADHFLVLGGGFIGSEIAAALAMNGKSVTMVLSGHHIGARIFPRSLASFLDSYYRSRGVELWPGEEVARVEGHRRARMTLATLSGRRMEADGVVAGLGIIANVELAAGAGLATDDGIIVDEFLATSDPSIFAAGDVANFPCAAVGHRLRAEHEDNALSMGLAAGRNMAGRHEPYTHLPFFYSDLFDLGYEAVGDLAASYETVEDWDEPFRKGVVYYLRDGKVAGVLLWNTWGQVDAARELIAQGAARSRADLIGAIRA